VNWWSRVWRGAKLEAQLDRELRFHLEQHAADLMARGPRPVKRIGRPSWRWGCASR